MTLVIILLGIALYFLWQLRQELTDISQRQRQLAASVDHLAGRLDAMQSNASRKAEATDPGNAKAEPPPEPEAAAAQDVIPDSGHTAVTSVEKAAAAAASDPSEPVNLNTANKSTLQTLPRIGRASADNIIAARPFSDVAQLAEVAGISPALYEELREQVTI